MNERIKELAEQADIKFDVYSDNYGVDTATVVPYDLEKFAELIVKECINQAHGVANLRGTNDDMIYGADTAAVKIAKHFGVE